MQRKFRLPDSGVSSYSSFLLVNEFASIASITYEADIRHFNAAFTEIREFPDILLSMVSGWQQPTASLSPSGLVSVDDGFGEVADGRGDFVLPTAFAPANAAVRRCIARAMNLIKRLMTRPLKEL